MSDDEAPKLPTAKELGDTLRDANEQIRRDHYKLRFSGVLIGLFAVDEYGWWRGLALACAAAFVTGFIATALADRWMRRKGLNR